MSVKKNHKELDVWKQARILVKHVYHLTQSFPGDEQYGLRSQMRRASVSVPSNIAEECGRNYTRDSLQFFFVARGPLYELETQLLLAFDLEYVSEEDFEKLETQITRCMKLTNGFINYFQSNTNNGQPSTKY